MYRRVTKILFIAFLFFVIPEIAQAGFLDDIAYCTYDGSCGFEEVAIGFSSLVQLLLGGMGAVALVFFVWGGIRWLISGGSAEKVNEGKTIMINTVFALILAFGSYIVLTFFINDVLGVDEEFRVETGEFVSCQGAVLGTPCGDYRQCVGNMIGDYEVPPGDPDDLMMGHASRCVSTCMVQALSTSIFTKEGACVTTTDTYEPVPGANLCPDSQICVYTINN